MFQPVIECSTAVTVMDMAMGLTSKFIEVTGHEIWSVIFRAGGKHVAINLCQNFNIQFITISQRGLDDG